MRIGKEISKKLMYLIVAFTMCLGTFTSQAYAAEYFSSDLSEFTSDVQIKDPAAGGAIIGNNGTLHVGSSYSISIAFSEVEDIGAEKQFQGNGSKQLTYQLPTQFKVKAISNQPIKLANQSIVATYSVTESGYLTVNFITVDNELYFDTFNNTVFRLDFECTVAQGATQGNQEIDFGNGKKFNMNITSDGELNVVKDAGNYDATTGLIEYTVKVTAVNGSVSSIGLQDSITSGNASMSGKGNYYGLDGSELPKQPTSLSAGEGFIWKYKVKVDDTAFDNTKADGRVTVNNEVIVSGKTNGKSISKPATKETHINYTNVQKEAVEIDKDKQTITWKITLGDGNRPLSSIYGNTAKITETLDDAGLYTQFFTGQNVTVNYYDATGQKSEGTINWSGSGTLNISTNNAYKAEFELVSKYQAKNSSKVGPATFKNTASIGLAGGGTVSDDATIKKGVDGVGKPDLTKVVSRDDKNNVLHYTITATIPAGYEDVPGFFLKDTISTIGSNHFSNEPKNIVITAIPVGSTNPDDKVVFTEDTSYSVNNTYFTENSGGKNEILITFFNTTTGDKENSKWTFDKDMILTIEYDLPLDAQSNGVTVQDALDKGGVLTNTAELNYNNGDKVEKDDVYFEVSEYDKKGVYDSNTDIIDYTYTFLNKYLDNTTIVHGDYCDELIFTDTLGGGMTYVDQSLYLDFYIGNDLKASYKYNGTIDGLTNIQVSTNDFVSTDGLNTTADTTLKDKYVIRYVDRIVYRYQAKVDRDSTIFTDGNAGTTVDLKNTAGLEILKNSDTKKKSPDKTNYVTVPNNTLNKVTAGLHDGNKLSFTIELNYDGDDLVSGASTYTVVDTLSSNITPVLNTIKVQIKKDGDWVTYEGDYKYDVDNNVQEFTVPDSVPVLITYDVKVNETGKNVTISNDASIKGLAKFEDQVSAVFEVNESSASASASIVYFNLYKYDGQSNKGLEDAVFAMYGPQDSAREGDAAEDSRTYKTNIPETIQTSAGVDLYYYRCYETDEKGVAEISSKLMSIGGMYSFKEVVAPDGYVKDDKTLWTIYAFDYPATGADNQIRVIKADDTIAIENKAEEESEYEILFSKIDVGGKEIDGATLTVSGKTADDKKIDDITWTTDLKKEPNGHIIKLEPGKYTLTESQEPLGYEKADSIDFTIDKDGKVFVDNDEVTKVTMKDAFETFNVLISKVDIGGKEIDGADLKVTGTNAAGVKITEITWQTDLKKEPNGHTIKLEPGNYTLTEVNAPSGYDKAESIDFTVGKDGKVLVDQKAVNKVTMIDEYKKFEVVISKRNVGGQELDGATLTVTGSSTSSGTIKPIQWKSDTKKEPNGHTIKREPGRYTLTEVYAPTGYAKAQSIDFTVDKDGKVTVDGNEVTKVIMVDEKLKETETNKNGPKTGNSSYKMLWINMMLISLAGLVVIVFFARKVGKI
ncbi:MAG: hypothetical protein HUJ53_05885 [Holdemanella sp.]|nr:hypothetical protein [Holdemanella sp.]